MNHGASTLLLGSVPWSVFGTLTYRDAPGRVETVLAHGLEYMELMRQQFRLHVNNFYWFFRVESGEVGGRLHAHLLVRVPPLKIGFLVESRGHKSWGHHHWSRGMTKFRRVRDNHDPAVVYISKQESCAADTYEIAKTARATHGHPSPALLRRAMLQKSAGVPAAATQPPEPHLQENIRPKSP